MHALAKMAELAINRQNCQTVNKNSNEMAKEPFEKWQFWRKWLIWQKWRKGRLIAGIAQQETKIQMIWQRGPLESGDFGENGVYGENGGNGD